MTPANVTLKVTTRGTTTITTSAFPQDWVRGLTTAADVMGWLYTIAWDVSFLPQILHNWRRRSVVGLSFDFLTFNWIGFFSYFIFNMGLYWLTDIQEQYSLRYPQRILHVRLNDVIFPLYAVVCVTLQIGQCFLYERSKGQRVSTTCRVLSGLLVASAAVGCVLVPLVESWWWLDVLYLLSYIKLTITCIKYVPQLWVNHKRRSTEGWSIYQVILDFTGGTLSLVQMFLLSGNYDDWLSLLTDPAKLGLGLLSIMFNILFFIQHYCLYRNTPSSVVRELKGIDGPLQHSEDALEHTKF
ncbi:cystinosin homolog isoform X2 [Portunus trituberculatus]|uniref:cystinosin homolog isoform X2 n=1 Tax=Portunus trituberculatus TaxID=210409 RepID=UPI001E1D2153|nr:cystinosin homolog isoform X2 [Portunus trituberculatus]